MFVDVADGPTSVFRYADVSGKFIELKGAVRGYRIIWNGPLFGLVAEHPETEILTITNATIEIRLKALLPHWWHANITLGEHDGSPQVILEAPINYTGSE